jgi:hypothetical protein
MPDCKLQARFGITEPCAAHCLYFEQGGQPAVGCLLKVSASEISPALGRQLLKSAGRRSR